jgi:hypothetical protein
MTILIAKQNQKIVQGFSKKELQFQEASKNTCIFKITPAAFDKMRTAARDAGYNPFALFSW